MSGINPYERYQRQTILPGFGKEGQEKLSNARVFVVGAGGLGCPVLQYLTAAGVGTVGIADDDVVALTDLHRQVLYSVNDIGFSKAERATDILRQLNPEITIIPYNEKITARNALTLFERFEVIIDCTDNFAARYLVNDACVLLKKPLVYGAISQFEGQVSVFKNQNDDDVNYRDLFPDPPTEDEVLNCAEAGVIGVLPGIVGTMMANEAIKVIAGIGEPLTNQLLTYNALTNRVYQFSLLVRREAHSQGPKTNSEFFSTDYEWLCSSSASNEEIDVETFNVLIKRGNVDVIDVREPDELPTADEFPNLRIPLGQLTDNTHVIKSDSVIAVCQTGSRSLKAVKILKSIFGENKQIYSLRGGILEWQNKIKEHEGKQA